MRGFGFGSSLGAGAEKGSLLLALATLALFLAAPCWAAPTFTTLEYNVLAGKVFVLAWTTDPIGSPIDLELVNGTEPSISVVVDIAQNLTSASIAWTPPTTLESGNYRFRISEGSQLNFSPEFGYVAAPAATNKVNANATAPETVPPASAAEGGLSTAAKIGIGIGSAGFVLLLVAAYFLFLKCRERRAKRRRTAASLSLLIGPAAPSPSPSPLPRAKPRPLPVARSSPQPQMSYDPPPSATLYPPPRSSLLPLSPSLPSPPLQSPPLRSPPLRSPAAIVRTAPHAHQRSASTPVVSTPVVSTPVVSPMVQDISPAYYPPIPTLASSGVSTISRNGTMSTRMTMDGFYPVPPTPPTPMSEPMSAMSRRRSSRWRPQQWRDSRLLSVRRFSRAPAELATNANVPEMPNTEIPRPAIAESPVLGSNRDSQHHRASRFFVPGHYGRAWGSSSRRTAGTGAHESPVLGSARPAR